jgi:hypothetical protein
LIPAAIVLGSPTLQLGVERGPIELLRVGIIKQRMVIPLMEFAASHPKIDLG